MADAGRRSARRYLDLVYPAGQSRPEPADWLDRAARTVLNEPHREQPYAVNKVLEQLWSAG